MRLALLLATVSSAIPSCAQFTMQTSNTTADLRGIHNVGNGVAWASGTHGTVLRTEDGGYVWQSCAIPPGAEKLDFRGVQAFDANTAIVMSSGPGEQSRLYKTTDGCHSWKLLFTNPDKEGFWDAVATADRNNIMILGDPVNGRFSLFSSTDAGANWEKSRDDGLRSDPDQGSFAASNSSLLVDWVDGNAAFGTGGPTGPRLYRECDSCKRDAVWSQAELPSLQSGKAAGIFSLQYRDWKQWIAVGGDYTKPDDRTGTAAFTLDRGDHWQPATTPPHGYRSSVAYDASTKTWITVGPNGTDISTDDGRNWRAIHPNPALHESADADRNWNALSLPYVVGPKGRIGRLDPAVLTRTGPLE